MAPEPQTSNDRDEALRRLLVREADASPLPRHVEAGRAPEPPPSTGPNRRRVAIVTSIVAVLVVAVSVVALTLPTHRRAPAGSTSADPRPSSSPTVGQVLAVLSSDDGRKQTRSFAPMGMSFNVEYTCVGDGTLSISVPHNFTSGAACSSGHGSAGRPNDVGRGNKGTAGTTTITISASNDALKWKATITAVKPTFTIPQPIATPTTSAGRAARYCTSRDLAARYRSVRWLGGSSDGDQGEIALRNTSGTACFLYGQPQLQFLDATGRPIGRHSNARTDQRGIEFRGIPTVELDPGHLAYVELDASNPTLLKDKPTDATCPTMTSTAMRLSLATTLAGPSQRGTITIRTSAIRACTNDTLQLFNTIYLGYKARSN
jgi:hypothetical protein